MSLNILNQKIKNVLILNDIHHNYKDSSRNNKYNIVFNNSIINTSQKIKRGNITIPIRRINPFHSFHMRNMNTIKAKNNFNYNINKTQKHLKKLKIFDDINNFKNINNNNFNETNLKTIEYLNYNKKRKTFKRYNTFKNLNREQKIMANKPPIILKNELFKLDRNFLREISPINNFININKKINEYKKENKRKLMAEDRKDSFYSKTNAIKDTNEKTINFKYFDFKKKLLNQTKNHKKLIHRRMPSFSNFKTYKL